MKFPIPKTIEDVTPELCRRVFTDICGGTIDRRNKHDSFPGLGKKEIWYIGEKPNDRWWGDIDSLRFNPFTRIQDTKLCDSWVFKNLGLFALEMVFHDAVFYFGYTVSVGNVTGFYSDESEPFARMCAILDAANKMMEGK
jgi:hypothetical protein